MIKNYSILAEYQRQYAEKFKKHAQQPMIADSVHGDNIEMDIDLPYKDTFKTFTVIYDNTETITLYYRDSDCNYVYKAYYKESQKVREVNLYNLMACASNLMARHEAAHSFEKDFNTITAQEFCAIDVEYFDERIAKKYCGEEYNKKAIEDCYRLFSYCKKHYFGRKNWIDYRVGSYGGKHVFEYIIGKILKRLYYVDTAEFAAAAVMFYCYWGDSDKLNIKEDLPNWNMTLPDYYEVLEYLSCNRWRDF
jgi:hypothetical protein